MINYQRRTGFFILLFYLSFFIQFAGANDSVYVQNLVRKIYTQQIKNNSGFPVGMFPTYREYYFNKGTLKNDDNIFFTALVVFTLRSIQQEMDVSSQRLCDSIFKNAAPLYKKFQNRKGAPVYSFWMTRPRKYFPNSGFLSLFKGNALPDDVDCTSIVLQAMNALPSVVQQMHAYIQQFANNKKRKVKSTLRQYKNLPAYSTWLGHKVPLDFDVSVLTNVLMLIHKYKLPYTAADSASLKLITEVVKNRQYMTDAAFVSPYYNKPSVILYHLARLMNEKYLPGLEKYRPQLIADALTSYRQTNSDLEKIVLSTTLLRWNTVIPDVDKENINIYLKTNSKDFVFFVANMSSMLPNPLTRWMMKSNIGRFDYYCPAYDDVLVLENLIWKERLAQNPN